MDEEIRASRPLKDSRARRLLQRFLPRSKLGTTAHSSSLVLSKRRCRIDDSPYEQLVTASSIRLLELMPGQGDEEIVCQLQHADLNEMQEYEAISYVWGDTKIGRTITCNGCAFEVTANLFLALQRFRKPNHPRWLWADAICINQQDLDERGRQVAIMRRIYEEATRVLVWLGPDTTGFAGAAATLTQMVAEEICRASSVELSTLPTLGLLVFNHIVDAADSSRLPPGDSEVWKPLELLFFRPWFNRVWVVQEAASAREFSVFCGDIEFDWDALGTTATWIGKQRAMSGFKLFAHTYSHEARLLYASSDYFELSDWVQVLVDHRRHAAADPRDKIYALLGLSSFRRLSNDSMPIVPNYKKSKLEVYKGVVETAIRFYRNLRILSRAECVRNLSEDWPTWVPCWDCRAGAAVLGSQLEEDVHRTSGDCKLGPYGEGWRIGHNILTVRGIEIATVKAVGDLMTLDHFHTTGKKVETVILHPIVRFFTDAWNERREILKEHQLNQIMSFCYGLTAGKDFDYQWVQEHSDEHLADFALYMSKSLGLADSNLDLCEVLGLDKQGNAERYEIAASRMCINRKLLKTSQGQIGIGPAAMQRGALVCILFGHELPVVLRPQGANYQLLGDAYVYDLMNGQGLEDYNSGKQASEEFNLC